MFEWIKNKRERSQRQIDNPEVVVEELEQKMKNAMAQVVKLDGYIGKASATAIEEGGKMYVNSVLEAENWFDKIGNIMGKPFKWGFGLVEKGARKIKNFFEDSETLAKTRISVREEFQKQISDDNIPLNNETAREYLILQHYNLFSEKEINDIINKRSKSNAISQAGSEKKGEFNKSKEELVTALTGLKEGKPLDNETKEDLLKVIQRLSDQSALLYEKTTESIAAKEKLEEHIKSGKPLKESTDLLLTMMIPSYNSIVNENKTLSGVSEKAEKSASKALDTWQQFMEKEDAEMLMKLKEKESSKVSKQLQQHGSNPVSIDDNQFHAKESITLNNYGKE